MKGKEGKQRDEWEKKYEEGRRKRRKEVRQEGKQEGRKEERKIEYGGKERGWAEGFNKDAEGRICGK